MAGSLALRSLGGAGVTTTPPALVVRSDQPEPLPRPLLQPSAGGRGLRCGQGQEPARVQEVGERDEQGLIGTDNFPN